jgi:hypothetical protein
MRKPILIVAVLMAGGSFAACSRPASEPGQPARDIRLQTPPASETQLVSTLEAGQRLPARHPASRASAPTSEVASRMDPAPAQSEQPLATSPQVVPTLSKASLILANAPEYLPMAHLPSGPAEGEGTARVIDEAYHPPAPAPRGPGILIRGGMGGIDDKCDLHARGRRPGIAINRITPPLFRSGIR